MRQQTPSAGIIVALTVSLGISFLLSDTWTCDALVVETGAPQDDPARVKLGVYMESLCPDSKRFFLGQLLPTYREVGAIMDVKLVPFGHARTLGDGKMICQHGPRECEGNRRMACIESRSKNQSEVLETIGCIFKDQDSLKSCLDNNFKPATFEQIENCTKAHESYQMMVEAEKATGSVGYVPHLTVNNESGYEIQEQAEHELKKTICKEYKGQRAGDACKSVLTE